MTSQATRINGHSSIAESGTTESETQVDAGTSIGEVNSECPSPIDSMTRGTPIKLFAGDQLEIHPTAIVHPKARLGPGVKIGPYCIIGEHVAIGARTILENNVTLQGRLDLGEDNHLAPYATLGLPPQHLKYRGEPTRVEIGDRNIFREYVTVHLGTVPGGGVTRIGSDNYLMVFVHIGHDAQVGNSVIIANSCNIGGHVQIEDHSNIGGMCGVHQFVRVGAYSMLGGCSAIRYDVVPYSLVEGNPARSRGLNTIGLKRNGFTSEILRTLKRAYRIVFRSHLTVREAIQRLDDELESDDKLAHFKEFILQSQRGILR